MCHTKRIWRGGSCTGSVRWCGFPWSISCCVPTRTWRVLVALCGLLRCPLRSQLVPALCLVSCCCLFRLLTSRFVVIDRMQDRNWQGKGKIGILVGHAQTTKIVHMFKWSNDQTTIVSIHSLPCSYVNMSAPGPSNPHKSGLVVSGHVSTASSTSWSIHARHVTSRIYKDYCSFAEDDTVARISCRTLTFGHIATRALIQGEIQRVRWWIYRSICSVVRYKPLYYWLCMTHCTGCNLSWSALVC